MFCDIDLAASVLQGWPCEIGFADPAPNAPPLQRKNQNVADAT
jgi:hypothetical protein